MTDLLPVAELDPPAPMRPPSERARPALWIVVGLLLISSIAAGVVMTRGGATPDERLAAAADQATAEDFAFEATVAIDGLEVPGGQFALDGQVDVDSGRLRGSMNVGPMAFELIQDGTTQYYRIPGAESAGRKPWQRLDLLTLGVPAGSGSTAATNPLDSFRQLGAIVGEVEEVGREQVRGVDTVHFRAIVDGTKTGPAPDVPAEMEAALRRIPVDVWLDDHDRPRRFRQTLDLRSTGAPGAVVTTVESFDFGKVVTIDLPPEGDVEDVDINGLGSLFGGADPSTTD